MPRGRGGGSKKAGASGSSEKPATQAKRIALQEQAQELKADKDKSAGVEPKGYRCDKCKTTMYQSEALILLDPKHANWDWQAHLPLSCMSCYNEDAEEKDKFTEQSWKKKCKAMWLQRKWAAGEQVKRIRNKNYDETRQQLVQEYPGEDRKLFRQRLYAKLVTVSAAIARALLGCDENARKEYSAATEEWREELQKKAEDLNCLSLAGSSTFAR
jgi:hypothetical protein